MARETSHGFVSFAQAHLLLESNDIKNRHVCLDEKLRHNAANNLLFGLTPYRCSLGRPKDFWERRRVKKHDSRTTSQLEESLPRISRSRESLVRRSGFVQEGCKTQTVVENVSHTESDEEEFQTCHSIKTGKKQSLNIPFGLDANEHHKNVPLRPELSRPLCHRSNPGRVDSLPLILGEKSSSDINTDASQCKSRPQDGTSFIRLLDESSSEEKEFRKIMDDGAKITVNQKKLSIEVFLPRMWQPECHRI